MIYIFILGIVCISVAISSLHGIAHGLIFLGVSMIIRAVVGAVYEIEEKRNR